ncbi:7-carboxy-7-deazaguanine synthase [invertebrate metagenome]|uniref:7-carboxy-7-deazaguanine synthase n=1 Tax=invertebrate metagenome TaxID=1711999 RepID=A0A2H9TAT2_9ZZZZ
MTGNTLRITEIFYSLQGETRTMGRPTVFVRLTGCPLRCRWCDTEYAFRGGTHRSLDDIETEVAHYKPAYVTVTGGEPLAQKECLPLLTRLADRGYEVSLETSGALDISRVDRRIIKVVDFKAPGSGEVSKNNYDNVKYLNPLDQVKFVIADRADYEWSVEMLVRHELDKRVSDVLFSPVSPDLSPEKLAGWILEDHLPVRFQLQLHRILWGEKSGC